MFKLVLALSTLLMFQTFASATESLEGFQKRFKIVRENDGAVKGVKMKMFNPKFSVKPYFDHVVTMVKKELERRKNKSYDFNSEVDTFVSQLRLATKSSDEDQAVDAIEEALRDVHTFGLEKTFKEIQTKGVLAKFEKDLRDVLMNFSLTIIARTEDSRFFYRRNVTYEVVRRAVDFARKRFDNVPVLSLISYVMVEVHDMIMEQRIFHQNMLLHYLSNFDAKDLGLTKKDADLIYSSIFESRIAATNFMESNRAAANWDFYGTDKFFVMLRTVNTRLRRQASTLNVEKRLNWAFIEVTEDGKRLIKNGLINKHMLSGKMATAYDFAKPQRIQRERFLMQLGQMGLGFIPIPGFIKNIARQFLNSMYVEQRRLEGALVGHFETTGNAVMLKNIKEQSMNPYLMF
jgi:hypothetical protein